MVRTYLDHLGVERGLSRNTLASYRRDLDRYLVTLAEAEVADLAAVTTGHVTRHLTRLREGEADHPERDTLGDRANHCANDGGCEGYR